MQLRFREPIAVLKGDRFIVRRASPSTTIGGGEVVDANPIRHRRFRSEVLGALETLAAGSPDEVVLQRIEARPLELRTLRDEAPSRLSAAQVDDAIAQLIAEGDARLLSGSRDGPPRPGDYVVAATTWAAIVDRISEVVRAFHGANPLRRGMPKEELRSRLRLGGPPRLFDDVLATAVRDIAVADDGATVRLPPFAIELDGPRRAAADRFLAALAAAPYAPPGPTEFGVDADTLGALIDLGRVVKVADGVLFSPDAMAEIESAVGRLIDQNGSLTLAAFRDHFGTSRKYAQATLEYLDQRRITRRVGDERVRFGGSGAGLAQRTGG